MNTALTYNLSPLVLHNFAHSHVCGITKWPDTHNNVMLSLLNQMYTSTQWCDSHNKIYYITL